MKDELWKWASHEFPDLSEDVHDIDRGYRQMEYMNIVESVTTVITNRPLFSVIDVQAVTNIVT